MKTDMVNIRVGSTVFSCEAQLAYAAGFSHPYTNDEDNVARDESYQRNATKAVAEALSEGFSGEAAVMRAIAIREQARRGEPAQRAAELQAQAAADNLRAEQIASARQKRAMG